jgi:hypothetical protein
LESEVIFAIEGPDLAGKTYFFDSLKKDDRFSSFIFVDRIFVKELLPLITYVEAWEYYLFKFLLFEEKDYFFDRFIFSSIVYENVFKRQRFPLPYLRKEFIEKSFFIHLNYDFDKKDFNLLRKEDWPSLVDLKLISEEYKKVFQTYDEFKVLNIDTTVIKPFDLDMIWGWVNDCKLKNNLGDENELEKL